LVDIGVRSLFNGFGESDVTVFAAIHFEIALEGRVKSVFANLCEA